MKLVIQRVSAASVEVEGKVVGKIAKGLFVLLGVGEDDSEKDADLLAEKLSKLRVMSDENDKMNLSVKDVSGQVLIVSQFTLLADTSKGNRPSFVKAGKPETAKRLYEYFIELLREKGVKVETGEFGEYMRIAVKLNGPVTITLES